LLVFFGAMLVLGAITALVSLTDNAAYFGHSHRDLIWSLTVFTGFPATLVCGYWAWRYARHDPDKPAGRSLEAASRGILGGLLVAFMVHAIATRIDHAVLFPAATTRTLARVEAPISGAFTANTKGARRFVWIPPLPRPLQVSRTDYAAMLASRRATDPAIDPRGFGVGGAFCVQVTIQVAETSVRLLDVGLFGLPSHSVHPCPAKYDDLFARLSVAQD
jgi:hypothetical protein